MGRLIKYELKKQQTSRNIILALLLVFLLAVVTGIFTDNGNLVGISVGMEIFVGMFVFFYMGIESLLILNRDLKTKQEVICSGWCRCKAGRSSEQNILRQYCKSSLFRWHICLPAQHAS